MRKLIVIGLAALMALPAIASRRVTVAQLDRALAADIASHRSDEDIARQVGELEMTERLSDAALNRFATTLNLQPRTALALELLADQSAFLDPPSSEFPATAAPDAATQQRMLDAAKAYSVETWARLPNFFVTRVTHRFDDTAQVLRKGEWPVSDGLHLVGNSTREITFRDGKEVQDPTAAAASGTPRIDELGLRSWGEFGPAMTVVLADMAGHRTTFSHWEKTSTGVAAVFHYEVPREASHYAVAISYMGEDVIGRTQFGYSGRNRSPQQVANIPRARELHTYSETPAYHGTISIDPATGAVERITIVADLGRSDPLLRAETAIEYGPVTIGNRSFICPARSIAVSVEPGSIAGCNDAKHMALDGVGDNSLWQSAIHDCENKPVLLINETNFSNYHRLGSTSRILTSVAGTPSEEPGRSAPRSESASTPLPAEGQSTAKEAGTDRSGSASATQSAASHTQNPGPQQDASQTASTTPQPPPPVAPSEPIIPEVSLSDAKGLPDSSPVSSSPAADGFSLKVTSRLVDVGVVAYDKKGRPVNDLKAEDFELYDNGRKQDIHFFSSAAPQHDLAAEITALAEPQPPEPEFSNRADTTTSPPSPAVESNATILLIDESHIAWSDMSYARSQILKFLQAIAPGERVGLYVMNGLGFHILVEVTQDHAALISRMQRFMPTAQSVSEAQEEETRNRQHFDEVHNAADLNSVNGNHIDVPDADQPIDPQLLTMGDVPVRASIIILAQVARHLLALPGHKNLVWVSSDNVLADWRDQSLGIDKRPEGEKAYEMRAQEAMNDAHAAVYPFDVSQLEASGVSADLQHQNVMLTPAAQDTAGLGGGQATSRNNSPGRIDAEMSQDIHPVQGQVRDVAANTGGRVIRRSGDLAGQLRDIVTDGDDTYMLSFSPPGPADGQYHTITVKLTGRHGLTLRYRTGYFFDKEPATLKERFQQAVWKPTDINEIAVTAHLAAAGASTNVQLNISAGDIGLEQQAGRFMDKLDIFFIERDDAGLHARVEGQTLGLRLKPTTYERLMPKGIPFDHVVEMHPGMASLRVLVVDENSGRMGSVTIPALALKNGG